MQALKGLRIFDMTRVLAGPFCTQILGDLGADVLKIEHPVHGDMTRTWGPPFERDLKGVETDESAYYLSCNRNKRSVALDITTPEGVKTAKKLIATSDVFVENFKVGFLAHHGLSYEDVKKIKPDIIYCSITGFGQTGPYAQRPGYDFQVQGLSGLMSLIGEPEGIPLRAGISIADIGTGLYSAIAILTALYHRAQTGEGQYIDMALLDSTMGLLSFTAQSYLLDRKLPPRIGNGHPNIVPYGLFESQDGYIIIAIGTDGQFEKFCTFIKDETFFKAYPTNKDRVHHRAEVNRQVQAFIKKKTKAYWIKKLDKIGIPVGPVNSLKEAFEDTQVIARQIATSFEGLKIVASPLNLLRTRPAYRYRPPHLGEHTNEVLREILTEEELENL
ncbi:MAG: CoA transferase [Alphaproteobacteria bacterium]|nr:CoA transferase [Alphaproteobacteria bacterium]